MWTWVCSEEVLVHSLFEWKPIPRVLMAGVTTPRVSEVLRNEVYLSEMLRDEILISQREQ